MHEADERHHPFNFGRELEEAPDRMQDVVQTHESLPWRRRNFERKGIMEQLLTMAGFPVQWKEPDAAEEAQAAAEVPKEAAAHLAKVPKEAPAGLALEIGRRELFAAVRGLVYDGFHSLAT